MLFWIDVFVWGAVVVVALIGGFTIDERPVFARLLDCAKYLGSYAVTVLIAGVIAYFAALYLPWWLVALVEVGFLLGGIGRLIFAIVYSFGVISFKAVQDSKGRVEEISSRSNSGGMHPTPPPATPRTTGRVSASHLYNQQFSPAAREAQRERVTATLLEASRAFDAANLPASPVAPAPRAIPARSVPDPGVDDDRDWAASLAHEEPPDEGWSEREGSPVAEYDAPHVAELRATLTDDFAMYLRARANAQLDSPEERAAWFHDHPDLGDFVDWCRTPEGEASLRRHDEVLDAVLTDYLVFLFA